MPPNDRKRLLTSTEVARELNIGERTVRQWAADGSLPKPVHLGGYSRWKLLDIEDWINQKMRERDQHV